MVGDGYHHPSVQWPNTPMDERQRGNPAAVACQRCPAPLEPCPAQPGASDASLILGCLGSGVHCTTNSSTVALRAPPILGVSTLCLLPRIVSQLVRQLVTQLDRQLVSQLVSQIVRQIVRQLDSQLDSQSVSQILVSQLDSQLISELDSQLASQIVSQLDSSIDSQLSQIVS